MESYIFPVAIGDTVKALVEDEDHVVDIIRYKVCGVAQVGEKQFVIDECGEMYEIGTRMCLTEEEKE